MTRDSPPRRGGLGVLATFALIVAAVMVFAPGVLGGWLGRLVGEVWATALGAITALLGGLFSGGQ